MKTLKRKRFGLVLWPGGTLVAVSVIAGFLALLFTPLPASADHAGAANCPHTHINAAHSSCTVGNGTIPCGEDSKGRCRDTTAEVFGVEVATCLCLKTEDAIPPAALRKLTDAVKLAINLPETYKTLQSALGSSGEQVACKQLNSANLDIGSSIDTLDAFPLGFYHPKFLQRIDWNINTLDEVVKINIDFNAACNDVGVNLAPLPMKWLPTLVMNKQNLMMNRPDLIDLNSVSEPNGPPNGDVFDPLGQSKQELFNDGKVLGF